MSGVIVRRPDPPWREEGEREGTTWRYGMVNFSKMNNAMGLEESICKTSGELFRMVIFISSLQSRLTTPPSMEVCGNGKPSCGVIRTDRSAGREIARPVGMDL